LGYTKLGLQKSINIAPYFFRRNPPKKVFTGKSLQGCHKNEFLLANHYKDAIKMNFYWQIITGMP